MEPSQVLQVQVHFDGFGRWEKFYANMTKDGRITMPKLTYNLLTADVAKPDLGDVLFEVELAPPDLEETDE